MVSCPLNTMLQCWAHEQRSQFRSQQHALPLLFFSTHSQTSFPTSQSVSSFMSAWPWANLVSATIGQDFCFQSWALPSIPSQHTFVTIFISCASFSLSQSHSLKPRYSYTNISSVSYNWTQVFEALSLLIGFHPSLYVYYSLLSINFTPADLTLWWKNTLLPNLDSITCSKQKSHTTLGGNSKYRNCILVFRSRFSDKAAS